MSDSKIPWKAIILKLQAMESELNTLIHELRQRQKFDETLWNEDTDKQPVLAVG